MSGVRRYVVKPMHDKDQSEPAPVTVRLATFGKHPAWDDHMEDLGLETTELNQFKELLYFSGIRGNIDAGAWDKPSDGDPPCLSFMHRILYLLPDTVILAQLRASHDGKGRSRYPLVVCAQSPRSALPWAMAHIPGRLDSLEKRLLPTLQANEVREQVDRARRELQDLALQQQVVHATTDPALPTTPNAVRQLAERTEMGPDQRGLLTVLYAIERQMGAFAPEARTRAPEATAQLRVPPCADNFPAATTLWSAFLNTQLHPDTPLMLICPLEAPWVDLLVGTPGKAQLFCLRATETSVPLTTSIPYSLEEDFLSRARSLLADALTDTVAGSLSIFRETMTSGGTGPFGAWFTRFSSLLGSNNQQAKP